jgi:hypothetical protein
MAIAIVHSFMVSSSIERVTPVTIGFHATLASRSSSRSTSDVHVNRCQSLYISSNTRTDSRHPWYRPLLSLSFGSLPLVIVFLMYSLIKE